MTGIFPNSGVNAADARNTLSGSNLPDLADGCDPLWHATARCQPRFDPAAANAVMAELLNLMKCNAQEYDCDRLDNLCKALALHSLFGAFDTGLFVGPATATASNVLLGSQTFTIPNSSAFDIPTLVQLNLRAIIGLNDGEGLTVTARLHDGPDVSFPELTQSLLDFGTAVNAWGSNGIRPVRSTTFIIPPGGRELTIGIELQESTTQPNGGQLTAGGVEITWYGARGNTFN